MLSGKSENGQTALFWNDSWQQLPVLAQEEWVVTFCPPTTQAGLTRVADYWRVNPTNATWRCWKSNKDDLHVEAQVDLQPWHNMINERKIPILQGEDILRWGSSPRGTFNIQEAYAIKANLNPPPPREVWCKIWSLKHWPKISIFLWLVAHMEAFSPGII
jgi:hypothetical protein